MINEATNLHSSGAEQNSSLQFLPWRRFWARSIDLSLYNALWMAVLVLVFHVNIMRRNNGENLLDSLIAIALMLLIEPLLLHIFATTPGKAVFGISVKSSEGGHLSYTAGLARTWEVIGQGLGFGIPVYNIIRLWRSYKACSDQERQTWDLYITYTIKDKKRRRWLYLLAACAACTALLLTIHAAQMLPPNRGELSIAQFVKNHNYYANSLGQHFGRYYLDENGVWRDKEHSGINYYFEPVYNEMPVYHFTIENGLVQGVSFTVEHDNLQRWLGNYDNYMVFVALALAGAQDEMRLFSKLPEQIITEIETHKFQSYQFFAAGLNIELTTEYSGYEIIMDDYLLPSEDTTHHYYRLNFTVRR